MHSGTAEVQLSKSVVLIPEEEKTGMPCMIRAV